MGPHLTYRPREGVVFGVVAGRSLRLVTLRNQVGAHIHEWEKVQEIRSGSMAGAVGHKLTVAENAALEIYDYPGEYAQRFDGVGPGGGGSPNHRHRGRVVWVKLTLKTRFPGGGFHLHGPPPCGNPRCIVIAQEWDSLFNALKAARQVSIVVEL